jgi:hypothetical protein
MSDREHEWDSRRCGNCRWWGHRGSTETQRPCTFPLPKWLSGDWVTDADNSKDCATWEHRLTGDDKR